VLIFARRLIVIVCVAALLLVALTPAASTLLLATLVPLWFFVSIFVGSFQSRVAGPRIAREYPFLPILASRPPPVA